MNDLDVSPNCQANRDRQKRYHDCTGCDCWCHHVASPPDLRAIYEAAKQEARTR